MNKVKANRIFNSSLFPEQLQHCIYQLLNKKGVVFYVGQTGDLQGRLPHHIYNHGEEFDSFSYEVVDREWANNAEALKIVELTPELNKALPVNDFFVTKARLKASLIEIVSDFVDEVESDIEFSPSKILGKKYISSEKLHQSERSLVSALLECKSLFDSLES